MAGTNSTVVRRQLGRKLRDLREASGRTRDDVVASRLMSKGKLEAIEHGRAMVRPGDAYELGRLYQAPPEILEALREMAMATHQEGWWQEYGGNLNKGFETYLDLETVASDIYAFQPLVVYGLLQTPEYARAVERGSTPNLDDATINAHVQLRMTRQRALLERDAPLRLHVVLGETTLRTQVGDQQVMDAQRDKLRRMGALDNVEIRVLPFSAGAHPGLLGGFSILDFDEPEDPSVAYFGSYVGARYNDSSAHVERHRQVYQAIYDRSVSLEEFQP